MFAQIKNIEEIAAFHFLLSKAIYRSLRGAISLSLVYISSKIFQHSFDKRLGFTILRFTI